MGQTTHGRLFSVGCFLRIGFCLMVGALVLQPWLRVNAQTVAASKADAKIYTVSQFLLDFGNELKVHPDVEGIHNLTLSLRATDQGYVAASETDGVVQVTLARVLELKDKRFQFSAVKAICRQIARHMEQTHQFTVQVIPHPGDIAPSGHDLRSPGQTALRLVINGGVAVAVQTPKNDESKPQAAPAAAAPAEPENKAEAWPPPPAPAKEPEPAPQPQPKADPKPEPKPDPKPQPKSDPQPAPKPETLPAEVHSAKSYRVSEFVLAFERTVKPRPSIIEMMKTEIELGQVPEGYVDASTGGRPIKVLLSEIQSLPLHNFYPSAIKAVIRRISEKLTEMGYKEVQTRAHPSDINEKWEDVRFENQTALRLIVKAIGPTPDEIVAAQAKKEQAKAAKPGEKPQPAPTEPTPAPEKPKPKEVAAKPKATPEPPKPSAEKPEMKKPPAKPEKKPEPAAEKPKPTPEKPAPAPEKKPEPTEKKPEPAPPTPKPQEVAQPPAPSEAPRVFPKVKPTESDGGYFSVSQITLEYAFDHPSNPPLDDVMETVTIHMAQTEEGGYVAAQPGTPVAKPFRVVDLPLLGKPNIYASLLKQITRAVASYYVEQGFIGVRVAPHHEDVDPQGRDIRPPGVTAFRLVVRLGLVTEMRTVAAGSRIKDEAQKIDNPAHQRIVKHSPVQVADPEKPQEAELLKREHVQRYIHWLNRHPGRNVDVAVSQSPRYDTGAVLDYVITEDRPWSVYFQVSNTGTENTEEWRERFGLVHNQLTDNDDILTLEYITSAFDATHAVYGSYEAPLFDAERVRWKFSGLWNEYTASELGFADAQFSGQEWYTRGDLIANVFQYNELFVDVFAGARYQSDEVESDIEGVEGGEEDFVLPHVGLQLDRFQPFNRTSARLQYEINVLDVDEDELAGMGRILVNSDGDFEGEENFSRLTWDVTHSFYLEPLVTSTQWRNDNPDRATLAHEMFFAFRGQWSPDRNIPQFERPVGGFYSVRGYDESILAGDTVLAFTAEYRFHLPRLFAIETEPRQIFGQPFRWARQQPYGWPDWDLILRGFFDYAQSYVEGSGELTGGLDDDFELMSAGAGVELQLKRNINLRVDWGYVLQGVDGLADEGDDRFHIIATFLY